MAHIDKTFDTASAAYDAGPDPFFHLNEANAGFDLAGLYTVHQLTLEVLDGGTFSVDVKVPGSTLWRTYQAGPLDEDTIVLIDEIVVDEIRVVMTGMGGGEAPVLVLNSSRGGE